MKNADQSGNFVAGSAAPVAKAGETGARLR
jgi:hypothetical protein